MLIERDFTGRDAFSEMTSGAKEYFPDSLERLVKLKKKPATTRFTALEIIYCQLDFDEIDNGGVKEFEIISTKYQSAIPSGGIEAFAKAIAKQKPTGTSLVIQPTVPPPGGKPIDIGVAKQCYVVLELRRPANWQFGTLCSITTDGDFHPNNCDLNLVDGDGNIYEEKWPNGCRVAYFSMIERTSYEPQKFNFHVDMVRGDLDNGGYAIGIIIDPDIRNTGSPVIPYP